MRSERWVFIFALKTMQSIQEIYSNYIMLALLATGLLFAQATQGGTQTYQPLSASVQISLNHAVSDQAPLKLTFATQQEFDTWLNDTSPRLEKRIPDAGYRADFLKTVYYEATRAGLDPQLVLGLIQVESGFKKYAVSSVGAKGYMQVMPFWLKLIGQREGNLFHLRTNIRYGCVILRHYLDIEKGDLFRALGRYNGSLGKPNYPNLVNAAWHKR